jgi:hypothetical protein
VHAAAKARDDDVGEAAFRSPHLGEDPRACSEKVLIAELQYRGEIEKAHVIVEDGKRADLPDNQAPPRPSGGPDAYFLLSDRKQYLLPSTLAVNNFPTRSEGCGRNVDRRRSGRNTQLVRVPIASIFDFLRRVIGGAAYDDLSFFEVLGHDGSCDDGPRMKAEFGPDLKLVQEHHLAAIELLPFERVVTFGGDAHFERS